MQCTWGHQEVKAKLRKFTSWLHAQGCFHSTPGPSDFWRMVLGRLSFPGLTGDSVMEQELRTGLGSLLCFQSCVWDVKYYFVSYLANTYKLNFLLNVWVLFHVNLHLDNLESLHFCVLMGRKRKLERRRGYQHYPKRRNLSFLGVYL